MKCKICSNNIEYFNVNDIEFYFCDECKFIQKTILINSQEEKARYLTHNNQVDDVVYQNYFLKMLGVVLNDLKKSAKILDFGSGPNPVLKHTLNLQGFNNVSIYDLFFAKDEQVLTEKYDIVFCIEVIEHIEDLNALLKLLYQISDKIVIKTGIYDDLNQFKSWWYHRDQTHISFLHEETFIKLSEMHNFQCVFSNGLVILTKEE